MIQSRPINYCSLHYLDFTLTAVDGMTERSDSGRTLGDASSSSFPQRSISASTAESDSSNRRVYVAALVKRRREIEEDLADLKVKLLESYREEWVSTHIYFRSRFIDSLLRNGRDFIRNQ